MGLLSCSCPGFPFPTKTDDCTAVISPLRCRNGKETDWLLCTVGGITKERLSAVRAVGSWAPFPLIGASELTRATRLVLPGPGRSHQEAWHGFCPQSTVYRSCPFSKLASWERLYKEKRPVVEGAERWGAGACICCLCLFYFQSPAPLQP